MKIKSIVQRFIEIRSKTQTKIVVYKGRARLDKDDKLYHIFSTLHRPPGVLEWQYGDDNATERMPINVQIGGVYSAAFYEEEGTLRLLQEHFFGMAPMRLIREHDDTFAVASWYIRDRCSEDMTFMKDSLITSDVCVAGVLSPIIKAIQMLPTKDDRSAAVALIVREITKHV